MNTQLHINRAALLIGLVLCSTASPHAALADAELNQQAFTLLEKYCFDCHGADIQESELRLDIREGLIAGGESGELLATQNAEKSYLWVRVGESGDMPPEGSPQPNEAEKEILRKWLASGAEYPQAEAAVKPPEQLAAEASRVFDQYCINCHGAQRKKGYLDFRHHETLVKALEDRKAPYVIAGKPSDSFLWEKMEKGMPPKNQPQMTDEDKQIVIDWIAAGAPYFAPPGDERPFVSELEVQKAIVTHMESKRPSEAKNQRYFTFTHLHNNPEIPTEKLQLFKAGLAKLVNSLTWEADIVRLEPVDAHQTVFAVDLRDMGWTELDHWRPLFRFKKGDTEVIYPYLLDFSDMSLEFRNLAERVQDATDSRLVTMPRLRIRADWFVANAARPPLYEKLLELPDTLKELEEKLEVNRQDDLKNSDMWRAGVLESGVSKHNRLLDRHRSLHGGYWISYDFSSSFGDASLIENPLGPEFEGNDFNDLSFNHDGGEVVYSLPNGMHGYYLCDDEGKHLDAGPIDIVEDSNRTSGSPEIVNGLSCLACHKNGLVNFKDEIRESALKNLGLDASEKVKDLFSFEIKERLEADQTRFLNAALEAMRPFLSVENIDELRDMPVEPIGEFARYFNNRDLTLQAVTAELYFEKPNELEALINNNNRVGRFLDPLLEGGVIKRTQWETKNGGANSAFQTVAQEAEKGVPFN